MPDGRDGRVVLIVREELVTRMDVADEFDKAGFKVLQARTAEEAITVLDADPTIRVVFTDSELLGRGACPLCPRAMAADDPAC